MAIRKKKNPEKRMSLGGHLDELRKCLFIILGVFVVATCVAYVFAPEFVRFTLDNAEGYHFIQTGVAELLGQYVKAAVIVGVVATLPVAIWQVDRFLRPGLKKGENTKVLLVMISGTLLFFGGAIFCYTIVIPFTLQFFMSLNTIDIQGLYSVSEYISYIVAFMVAFGVIFEMPVVAAILTGIGVLRPRYMTAARRVVLVLCFVIGAIITPPDVASQTMVALPMYLLYEISIIISRLIYAGRKRRLAAEGIDIEEEENSRSEKRQSRWAEARRKVDMADKDAASRTP